MDFDIFISYSWGLKIQDQFQTQEKVKILKKYLEDTYSYRIWMDVDYIKAGHQLQVAIAKALRASKCVIVVLTKEYTYSKNCLKEISLADALGKPIIPLLFDKYVEDNWPPENVDIFIAQSVYSKFNNINLNDLVSEPWWPEKSIQEVVQQVDNSIRTSSKPDDKNFLDSALSDKEESSSQNRLYSKNWEYFGQVKNDMPHGLGTKIWVGTNSSHSGEWALGQAHGQGVRIFFNQNGVLLNQYKGSWQEGVMQGQGSITFSNGHTFFGEIENGKRNGFGRSFNPEGDLIYEGIYKNGDRDGKGILYNQDGSKYIGEYKGQFTKKKMGEGKFVFSDGTYYTGTWKDGKVQFMTVKFYYADGKEFNREDWSTDGVLENEFGLYWLDGSHFTGKIVDGKKNGQGKFYDNALMIREGEWKDNELNGDGKEYNDFGRLLYKGEFKDGYYVKGCLYYYDGRTYEGEFKLSKYTLSSDKKLLNITTLF